MSLRLAIAACVLLSVASSGQVAHTLSPTAARLDKCHGNSLPLKVMSGMPYVTIVLEGKSGSFVLDWGSLDTVVDAKALLGSSFALKPNSYVHKAHQDEYHSFSGLEFFGAGWNPIDARVQDMSGLAILDEDGTAKTQVGILAADLIAHAFFTVDYRNRLLYRQISAPYCTDDVLRKEGFLPVSTAGYFADSDDKLNNRSVFNVPTVPIRIGLIAGIAQVDSGFDDKNNHSLLINEAMLKALQDAGVQPVASGTPQTLTTCVNSTETITPYTLTPGTFFEVTGASGTPVIRSSTFKLFLKVSPPDASSCGGIGTWKIPAGQFGSSFLIDAGQTVYDPISSRVWFGSH